MPVKVRAIAGEAVKLNEIWGIDFPREGELTSPMKAGPFSYLPPAERAIVEERTKHFRGFADKLSAALGALTVGQYYGWRGLYFIHSPSTVRKYEKLLGIKFADVMPERTEETRRLLGVRVADEIGRYWAVVKGEVTVPGGRSYADDKDQADLFQSG